MPRPGGKRTRRRDFLRVGFTAAALGPFFAFPARTLGSQKTLKIARWAHLVPEFDEWFAGMAKAWGLEHDTNVVVDFVHREEIHAAATAELRAGQGHDLCMFPWPPAEFQQHAIDHTEIYQTVAAKFGNVDRLGHRSTFNPRTRKYFAFADSWIPAPFLYFEDYWTQVNIPMGPVHYDGLRSGGKRLRDKLGIPTGLPFAPSLESNVVLHTLLFAFNSRILDIEGNVIINKTYRTITALKYAKALYQDTGTPEQLTWGPSGSVNAMLARKTSCTINGISLLRAAEKHAPEVARKIRVSPPLLGSGGMGVLGLPHVTNCSAVWNFAQNPQGAKQFLADLVDTSAIAYEKSAGCNFPIYQKTLPNLIVRLENDPQANPPGKYAELKDALHWTHNLGLPGFANPVAMQAFNAFVIPRMFLSVVKGQLSPEDAVRAAEAELTKIADKWKQA